METEPEEKKDPLWEYAQRENVLALVDDMVNQILVSVPADPIAFMVTVLCDMQAKKTGTSPLGATLSTAWEASGRDAPAFTKLLTEAIPEEHLRQMHFIPHPPAEDSLQQELSRAWEAAEHDVKTFNKRLEKKLPLSLKKGWKGASSDELTPADKNSRETWIQKSKDAVSKEKDEEKVQKEPEIQSKFCTTADAKEKETDVIEKVNLYEEHYTPKEGVFEVVHNLQDWHAAGKVLWPVHTVQRFEKNCRMMERFHNYGEPSTVVIPLFLYSTSFVHDVVWSAWVSFGKLGRWFAVSQKLRVTLEKWYRHESEVQGTPPQEIGHFLVRTCIGEELKTHSKVREADGEPLNSEIEYDNMPCTLKMHEGRRTMCENSKTELGWEGLSMYGHNWGCMEGMMVAVYIARYSLKDAQLEDTDLFPLTDTVAWLPVPCCMFPSEEHNAGTTDRDTGADDGRARRAMAAFVSSPMKTMLFSQIPPPGILDYIMSRRSQEKLSLEREDAEGISRPLLSTENVFLADPEKYQSINSLCEKCVHKKNQQQYDEGIHRCLTMLLNEPDYLPPAFHKLILQKLLPASIHGEPTPLNIMHALDIQRVQWKQGVLYVALSGSRCLVIAENGEPCPIFRLASYMEDQPYWHLNATMRSKQNKWEDTTVTISAHRQQRKQMRHMGHMGHKGKDIQKAVYHAREPHSVGKGIDCLALAADNAKLKEMLAKMKPLKWATDFTTEADNSAVRYFSQETYDMNETHGKYLDPVLLEKVGWWLVADGCGHYLAEEHDVAFSIGTWMAPQVCPMLYYIDKAMKDVSHVVNDTWRCAPLENEEKKCYRGLANARLSNLQYSSGNVVLWSAFSSASEDQGISQAFANGKNGSVFIMRGTSCRLIALWSRFGRESEWLFSINSMFQVETKLSEDQQSILGKTDFQLYEISEVTDAHMQELQVRRSLPRAETKEIAGVIFSALRAVKSGNGVLDISVKDEKGGAVEEKWLYSVYVLYNPVGQCPVTSSQDSRQYDTSQAEKILSLVLEETNEKTNDYIEGFFDTTTPNGQKVLVLVAFMLGVSAARGPSFVELDAYRSKNNPDKFQDVWVTCKNPSERWEVLLALRREEPQEGCFIGNMGAVLLEEILLRQVCLKKIDVRMNRIDHHGARRLLNAVKKNKHVQEMIVVDSQPILTDALECKVGTLTIAGMRAKYASPISDVAAAACTAALCCVVQFDGMHEENMMQHFQRLISVRCKNKGHIHHSMLEDYGSAWTFYFASALKDAEVLSMDYGEVYDNDPKRMGAFLYQLAENCVSEHIPFPKMPGALVAAARCGSIRQIKMLIDMGCDPYERDQFGETPYKKLLRRKRTYGENFIDWDPAVEHELCVPLSYIHPYFIPVPEWQIKNFALEIMRICESSNHTIVDEVTNTFREYRRAAIGLVLKDDVTSLLDTMSSSRDGAEELMSKIERGFEHSRTKVTTLLRKTVKGLQDVSRTCPHLSKRTPIGRVSTTLMCLKLLSCEGQELQEMAGIGSTLFQVTHRRKHKGHKEYLHKHTFRNVISHPAWDAGVRTEEEIRHHPETKQWLTRCAHGSFHKTLTSGVDEKTSWDSCLDAKVIESETRGFTCPSGETVQLRRKELFDRLWNEAEEEEKRVRKLSRDTNQYVFERDWQPADGDWATAPVQTLRPIQERLALPLATLYDPTNGNGGWSAVQRSRDGIKKWVKLWACTNIVLASGEEEERVLYRRIKSSAVVAQYMKLKKGRMTCLPDLSHWVIERRLPHPNHHNEKGEPGKKYTRQEFIDELFDDGELWGASRRKWTKKGFKGTLEYEAEFKAIQRRCEDNSDDALTWNEADPEDPLGNTGSVGEVMLIARGKILAESINKMTNGGPDVMIPGFMTFVVEKLTTRGDSFVVHLISRGCLLKTDKEVATWASRMQSDIVKKTEDILLDDNDPPENPPDDVGQRLCPRHVHQWLNHDTRIFFGNDAAHLPADGRAAIVNEAADLLACVSPFEFSRIHNQGGSNTYNFNTYEKQQALPFSYRPIFAFLEQLGWHHPTQENFIPLMPKFCLKEPILTRKDAQGKEIEVSARTIAEAFQKWDKVPGHDPKFKALGIPPPNVEGVFGDGRFTITVGELQQIVKSTILVTSPDLPKKFFQLLVGRFTAVDEYAFFFRLFAAESLADIANDFDTVLDRVRCQLRDAIERDGASMAAAKALLDADNFADKAARMKCEWEYHSHEWEVDMMTEGARNLNSPRLLFVQERFALWVKEVLDHPSRNGLISAKQARFVLSYSILELSSEVCIAQKGFLFTKGVHGGSNQICERTHRHVTFLCSSSINFYYKVATLREARKYFQRIAEPGTFDEQGWKYFIPQGRELFHTRCKSNYHNIFEAAKQLVCTPHLFFLRFCTNHRACATWSCHPRAWALPCATSLKSSVQRWPRSSTACSSSCWLRRNGGSTWYAIKQSHSDTSSAIPSHSFTPQYWLSAPGKLVTIARMALESVLDNCTATEDTDQLRLRSNICFHNADVKYLAARLSSEGKASGIVMSSSDDQLLQGAAGVYFERARSCVNFCPMEELASTSTSVLMDFHECGSQIGLADPDEEAKNAPPMYREGDTGKKVTEMFV